MEKWISTLISNPYALLTMSAFLLTAFGIGTFFSDKVLHISWRHRYYKFPACLIFGIDLTAIIALFAGLSGIVSKELVIAGFILGSLGGIYFIFIELKQIKFIFSFKKTLPFFFLLAVLTLLSAPAFCPPVGWDELVYHVELPLRWLSDGYPYLYKDLPYSGFPSLPEILFWICSYTGGITVPGMITFSVFAISVFSIFVLLRSGLPNYLSVLLVMALVFSPVTLMTVKETYIEFFVAMNLLGAFLFYRGVQGNSSFKNLVFIGIFAGAAAATKLTGGAVSLIIILFLIKHKESISKNIKAVIISSLTAFIFMLPFYLRPFIMSGNPFYPYFPHIFASTGTAAFETGIYHHATGASKFGTEGISGFLLNPFFLTFYQRTFDGTFGFQASLLLLLLVAGLFFLLKNRDFTNIALKYILALIVIYTFWFFSAQQARFLLPAFVVLILLSGKIISYTFSNKKKFMQLFSILLAFMIPFSVWYLAPKATKHYYMSWELIFGKFRAVDYIYMGTGESYLPAMADALTKTPEDARILMIFEDRGLYLPRKHFIGSPFFQEKFLTPHSRLDKQADFESIKAQFKENKITHLLIGLPDSNPDMIRKYIDTSVPLVKNIIIHLMKDKKLKPVSAGKGFFIYKIQNIREREE